MPGLAAPGPETMSNAALTSVPAGSPLKNPDVPEPLRLAPCPGVQGPEVDAATVPSGRSTLMERLRTIAAPLVRPLNLIWSPCSRGIPWPTTLEVGIVLIVLEL